jgi:hypothetical protein
MYGGVVVEISVNFPMMIACLSGSENWWVNSCKTLQDIVHDFQ